MLKLEFLEDYKIFKKGQKINFFDENKSAYTVIGYNESGKTIYLNVLKYIFKKDKDKEIDKDLNCSLRLKVIDEKNETKEKRLIIKEGLFDISEDLESKKIIDDLIILMTNLKEYLEEHTNFNIISFTNKEDITMEFAYNDLVNEMARYENLFSGYSLNNLFSSGLLKDINDGELEEEILNNLKNIESKIKEKEQEFSQNRYPLNLIEVDTSSIFDIIDLKNHENFDSLIDYYKDNQTIKNFINIIEGELKNYYSSDKKMATKGAKELEEKIIKINKDFNNYYPNYAKNEFFCATALHNDISAIESSGNIKFEDKSAGYKFWINIFINFYNIKSKNNIIILDEPAYNLHLEAQEQFVEYLEEYANENILIWSTHSPALINTRQNINVFERKGDIIEITNDFSNNFKEGKYLINTLTFLTKNTKNGLINLKNKKLLLVEGISDFYIFKKYFTLKKLDEEIFIIPIGGIQHFKDFIPFLLNDNYDNIYVICDKDNGKSESKKAKEELRKVLDEDKIYEIEDNLECLYPDHDIEENDKKYLAQCMLEDKYFIDITKNIDNIKILDFLELT